MNTKVLIFSILAIFSNIEIAVTQLVNNNNLVTRDIQILLSNTQRSIRAYLPASVIQKVDVIFASTSLNVSSILNRNYNCIINNLTSIILRKT